MPAGSKTDPPLAKAEPISNSGSASVITYLRKGKKLLCNSSWKRGVRICKRNNSADTKVSEGGGAPGARAEIPLQPMVKTVVRQAVPLQPMEVHSGADIHLQPVEDPTLEQVDVPEGGCDAMEIPHWSRFLAGPVTPWIGPTLELSIPEGLHPVERTHAGAVRGELQPVEGPTLEKFVEDCLPWEGPHAGAGGEFEEEGVEETTCDELTAIPVPPSTCATQGEEVEKIRSEAEPGKKGGVRGRCFKIFFSFPITLL
ncbi:uncharacterized protein ACIBXB_005909 [Morphnus guianensis]